jgi:hypothetical protein
VQQGKQASGALADTEHLEREEETIEPEEDTTDIQLNSNEVTETLEFTPGKFWVRRIVRPKYARKTTGRTNHRSSWRLCRIRPSPR